MNAVMGLHLASVAVGAGVLLLGVLFGNKSGGSASTPATPTGPVDSFSGLGFGLPGHPVLNALNAALHQQTATQTQNAQMASLAAVLKNAEAALAAFQGVAPVVPTASAPVAPVK